MTQDELYKYVDELNGEAQILKSISSSSDVVSEDLRNALRVLYDRMKNTVVNLSCEDVSDDD